VKYSRVIDYTHIFLPKDELKNPIDQLKKKFTVISKYGDSVIPIYKEVKGYFGVPRYFANFEELANEYLDKRADGDKIAFNVVNSPRERQKPVLSRFSDELLFGKTGFLLNAPTGTGKTYMMLWMLSQIGRTALVIVPREYILEQWIDMILQHTDLKSSDIGIVQQNKCDFSGKKIVVGMLHSLALRDYGKQFYNYFGAVVWDEVHTVSTELFSKTINLFPARYRIGASATLNRKDGTDIAYRLAVGETLLQMGGTADLSPIVFMKEYKTKLLPPAGLSYFSNSKKRYGIITSFLAEDPVRNAIISDYVHKLYRSGRRVLMLTDRKIQVEAVAYILAKKHEVPPHHIGFFTGDTPRNARKVVIDSAPIILATYGVMRMAVDAPDLSGLVFGTPLSDVEQAVGRILRKCEGKQVPVVIDIVDTALNDTVRWAHIRKSFYLSRGAEVKLLVPKE